MADRKLTQEYEDAVMNLAISEMMEEYGKELEEEFKNMEKIEPDPEYVARFQKAMKREFIKGKIISFFTGTGKFGKYAITICAALIIIFSISVVSVDALRFKLVEWLTHSNDTYTKVDHIKYNDESYLYNETDLPKYIPDGYELTKYEKNNHKTTVFFSNNDSSDIVIEIYSNEMSINIDNDNLSDYEELYFEDFSGYIQTKDNILVLVRTDNVKLYRIRAKSDKVSKEELVKIAQSF